MLVPEAPRRPARPDLRRAYRLCVFLLVLLTVAYFVGPPAITWLSGKLHKETAGGASMNEAGVDRK